MKKFMEKNISKIVLDEAGEFPPTSFSYENIGTLTLLGISRKKDLEPVSINSEQLIKASMVGQIGQYIYATDLGEILEIYLYQNEESQIIMCGIRTLEKPSK
ncbi:MAG: hypothetical protein RR420_01310 [Anaerovoracaceae bacterium]